MTPEQIKPQQTYRTEGGKLVYVQEIDGPNVVWCDVGSIDRRETSLKRFASRMFSESPNQ